MPDKYIRGSEWRRWDLHIHTPKSMVESEYGGNTDEIWERFISELENLPGSIKVIGINDYLTIDGYKKVLEFQAEGRLKNLDLILPVVEFRLKEFVGNRELKRLNYHIIFADSSLLTPAQIEAQFLNGLKGNANLDPEQPDNVSWAGVVNETSLYDLGKAIYESIPVSKRPPHPHFLKIGFNNINFELNKIYELLGERGTKNKYLHDKYFKAIGKNEWESFTWEGSISEKKTVINDCHFIFVASENTDQAKKSKDKLTAQNVNNRLFHCSDAHKFCEDKNNTKSKELSHCFTWINADPTFEGLRQVIWDSNERLRLQERNPDDTRSGRTVIDHVEYIDSNEVKQKVYFNKDLNSIIGRRGMGKSTLIKNIANKVAPTQFLEKDKRGRFLELYNFKVIWGDQQQDGGTDESPKSLFYIPQNYLSSLAYDEGEKTKERDQFLTKLLKKNTRFARAIQIYDEFSSTNKVKIESEIENLLKAHSSLAETFDYLKKLGAKKEIENEITAKKEDVKKYKGTGVNVISDAELSQYSSSKRIITENLIKNQSLEQDRAILNVLLKMGANIFITNQEFNSLSVSRQKAIKADLIKKGNENLTQLVQSEITIIDSEIKKIHISNQTENTVVLKLDKKIKANKALEELTKEIVDLQQIVEKIDELTSKTVQLKSQKEESLKQIVHHYQDFEIQQKSIFGTAQFDDTFQFLKIKTITNYNTNELKNFVDRNLNTRDSEYAVKQEKEVEKLFSNNPEKLNAEGIKKIIGYIVEGRIEIKVEANSIESVLSLLLRNRHELDYLNSVQTKDGAAHFKDMTGGQKAIALLELIFKFDDEKYPIIIDQPEDDLDVGGVATDLASFIRDEKQQRQIIIVSHNASLVICADTEEVIVSSGKRIAQGRYDFSYHTGAIENPEIRDSIIQILEGGRTALKQRARKLNFNREI